MVPGVFYCTSPLLMPLLTKKTILRLIEENICGIVKGLIQTFLKPVSLNHTTTGTGEAPVPNDTDLRLSGEGKKGIDKYEQYKKNPSHQIYPVTKKEGGK